MKHDPTRRRHLHTLLALGLAPMVGHGAEPTAPPLSASTRIGASWRGPQAGDPHFAGILEADWDRKSLRILWAQALPTRAHGLLAQADGSLLITGVRPGTWLMRCDTEGRVAQRLQLTDESPNVRLSGHADAPPQGDWLYTTETDYKSGRGRIGVRDRLTLQKLDEWDSHGIEPHQLVLDQHGHLMVANGGVPRTLDDRKVNLDRMDSSLVRLDGRSGRLLRQWKLDDPHLSLRHLAWSMPDTAGRTALGVAMQAEHADPAARARAPTLAVLEGDALQLPTTHNDGTGYAGDISAAHGGFVLSSNKAGLAQVWQRQQPERLTPVVKLKEAYALASWAGPAPGGGVLVAAAAGLVRWHPSADAVILPWPQPMALDNHWVRLA